NTQDSRLVRGLLLEERVHRGQLLFGDCEVHLHPPGKPAHVSSPSENCVTGRILAATGVARKRSGSPRRRPDATKARRPRRCRRAACRETQLSAADSRAARSMSASHCSCGLIALSSRAGEDARLEGQLIAALAALVTAPARVRRLRS